MDNRLVVINEYGQETIIYEPDVALHQPEFHASTVPNVLALGTRGTGKSLQLRMDAILRCLMVPNFHALILRRTMPELRRSHLVWIDYEMKMLSRHPHPFLHTTNMAQFDNGSTITFGHCETPADVLNYLSTQYGFVGFDELSTFTLEQFLQISASARAPADAPYQSVVRAGSNPLGLGADWMYAWFIDKTVRIEEYPDYNPDDFQMIFSKLEDNKHLDRERYTARLKNLPEHVRRAWLLGERVMEGAYFPEFCKTKSVGGVTIPWHTVKMLPIWKEKPALGLPWLNIYRSVDWGYFPDPAVCHWHLVLPNKHKITFKEQTWTRTLAADVAKAIKQQSVGMHIVDTLCDPTMYIKTGNAPYSIAEIFEQNGVPVTASQNNRELYGYAIHEMLSTEIDGHPSWQIVESACPELVRTLPLMQMDKTDTRKLADGPDHWVVSCAYFGMSNAPPSRDPIVPVVPRWMRPKRKPRLYAFS